MTKDEALKIAIEAIEFKGVRDSEEYWQMMDATKNACKEALEQPDRFEGYTTIEIGHKKIAQEPVAWIKEVELLYMKAHKADNIMNWKTNLGLKPEPDDAPLYTHPHQWQGLTDDEMHEVIIKHVSVDCRCDPYEFARAIEQALKEKNHGI